MCYYLHYFGAYSGHIDLVRVLSSLLYVFIVYLCCSVFFFQAEDGIRDLVRSRGLGDVYKRQVAPSHTVNGQGYLLTADSVAWYRGHYIAEAAQWSLSLIHI